MFSLYVESVDVSTCSLFTRILSNSASMSSSCIVKSSRRCFLIHLLGLFLSQPYILLVFFFQLFNVFFSPSIQPVCLFFSFSENSFHSSLFLVNTSNASFCLFNSSFYVFFLIRPKCLSDLQSIQYSCFSLFLSGHPTFAWILFSIHLMCSFFICQICKDVFLIFFQFRHHFLLFALKFIIYFSL